MTHEFADIAVFKLLQMCLLGCVVYFASNAASTRQAEAIKAKKKKTTVAGKSRRREAAKYRLVKGRNKPSTAKGKPEPLSIEDQRRVDAYRIGRDWPGFKNVSNIPL